MKKVYILTALLFAGTWMVMAQRSATEDCDCPSCLAAKEGTFTLPGLAGLKEDETVLAKPSAEEPEDHTGHDPDKPEPQPVLHDHDGDGVPDHALHDDHSGHDHGAEPVPHDHDGDGVPDHVSHEEEANHEGHDHADHDDHSGHDHDAHTAGGIEVDAEMMRKLGIHLHEAKSGTVARSSVFPAEIKLNRDTTAAVSPRYPSVVRQVFAEIGDEVKKGDVLASLENRETMAVYTVAAPLDGVIISKDLALGETAGVDEVLFEVADLSSVWADISIFPQYQHMLRKGMTVRFIAHDGHTARGVIKYISPIISHETRTFTARCVLTEPDEDFTPGAFVRARINVETVAADVVIAREAIQTLDGETVVFIPGDHGFEAIPVVVGLDDGSNVEIKRGLSAGTAYVAEGAFVLKAQMITSGMDPHAGHGH